MISLGNCSCFPGSTLMFQSFPVDMSPFKRLKMPSVVSAVLTNWIGCSPTGGQGDYLILPRFLQLQPA